MEAVYDHAVRSMIGVGHRAWLRTVRVFGNALRSGMLCVMQITVRLPDDLAEELSELVGEGGFPNRSAAVAAALRAFVRTIREQRIDDEYRDAYTRVPPTADEVRLGEDAGRRALADEPW
jgi:Arc/MetJ-type ribon-helix-helix transcriptional regulator